MCCISCFEGHCTQESSKDTAAKPFRISWNFSSCKIEWIFQFPWLICCWKIVAQKGKEGHMLFNYQFKISDWTWLFSWHMHRALLCWWEKCWDVTVSKNLCYQTVWHWRDLEICSRSLKVVWTGKVQTVKLSEQYCRAKFEIGHIHDANHISWISVCFCFRCILIGISHVFNGIARNAHSLTAHMIG